MKTRIPEDLSDLPNVGVEPEGEEQLTAPELLPEDMSKLEDAPELTDEEAAEALESLGAAMAVGRRWTVIATLAVVAVAGLALIATAVRVSGLLMASAQIHPWLAWVTAGLVALLAALIGIVVRRQVIGYMRLASFTGLRRACSALAESPRDSSLERLARHELVKYLGYLEESGEPEMLVRIQRARECMDVADSALEWQEDIQRVVLSPQDEEALAAIRGEALNVGLGTAISPYGLVDATIAAWRNFRLVRQIAEIYRVRAGGYGTFLVLRRTIAAVAVADLAQETTVAVLGTTRSLTSMVAAPIAQGLANAAMTILVGLRAQEQCRPIALPDERRQSAVKMLARSVADGVKRLRPREKRPASSEQDG